MSRHRQGRAARMSGFTLVEILVVITLMSMVMLALGAAMRTIAQTEGRVDQRLKQSDEMRVATGFLASTLGRISARKNPGPIEANASPYLFAGGPSAMMWVGVMPARYGAGGRYFFRLAMESPAGHPALVIRFAPWNASPTFPAWETADSRVLAADAGGLSLEYSDEEGPNVTWLPQWSNVQKLPGRVRIAVKSGAGEWPFLVVPMRQLPVSDNGRGGFSLGPE